MSTNAFDTIDKGGNVHEAQKRIHTPPLNFAHPPTRPKSRISKTPFHVSIFVVDCQLLPKGSDLSGAGSLAAILATPEVLEAAAVLAFLSGMVIWAVNFTRGAVTALRATAIPTPGEDDDD